MPHRKIDFKAALDADMADKGINERLLGQALKVTQQSISKWRHRGFPPLYRVHQLVQYFGPNSRIAKLDFTDLVADVPRVRVQPPQNVLPSMVDYQTPASNDTSKVHVGEPSISERPAQALSASSEMVSYLRTTPQRDKFFSEQMVDFVQTLPEELRENLLPVNTKISVGEALVHPDYLSETLALINKIQLPGELSTGKSQHILELAAIKKQHPHLRCIFALCYPGPDPVKAVGATRRSLAEMMGVEVWIAPTGGELARLLARAEGIELGNGAPRRANGLDELDVDED